MLKIQIPSRLGRDTPPHSAPPRHLWHLDSWCLDAPRTRPAFPHFFFYKITTVFNMASCEWDSSSSGLTHSDIWGMLQRLFQSLLLWMILNFCIVCVNGIVLSHANCLYSIWHLLLHHFNCTERRKQQQEPFHGSLWPILQLCWSTPYPNTCSFCHSCAVVTAVLQMTQISYGSLSVLFSSSHPSHF